MEVVRGMSRRGETVRLNETAMEVIEISEGTKSKRSLKADRRINRLSIPPLSGSLEVLNGSYVSQPHDSCGYNPSFNTSLTPA